MKSDHTFKPTWPRVRFGDVVQLNKDRSADPAADGIERYVAIEHIEPEDLRIRSWGLVAEGTTFTQRIRPGQTLFVKRRAYQRKVAVAEFDAVCSGDIYVLEPKDDRLLPELLPFLCQTDAFFEHAVNTSAGSLSPRTNWTQLAQYEFALPSLAEQRELLLLIEAAASLVNSYKDALVAFDICHTSLARRLFSDLGDSDCCTVKLKEVCDRVCVGIAASATHAYRNTGTPMIRNNNIKAGKIELEDLLYLAPEYDEKNYRKRVKTGDVITARTGIPGASAVVPPELDKAQTFTTLISSPKQNLLDSYYLCWWLNSLPGQHYIASRKAGGVQQNLNATLLQEMPIQLPSLEVQKSIALKLEQSLSAKQILERRLDTAHRNATAIIGRALDRRR